MKDKQILKTAVLYFANETAKNLSLMNYLLENVREFKSSLALLENAEDVEVYKEIFGFGKSKPMSVLSQDEQAVVKVLKDKIDAGMKELPKLTRVSIDDPTNLGVSLEKMIELVKGVQESGTHFMEMVNDMDGAAQEELAPKVQELMKAKTGFLGLVAFKLTELRKEAQAALQKLVTIVPSGQLSHALELAKSGYKPSLPMRSALDVLTSRDLPAGRDKPGSGMGAMGSPLGLRMGESLEEETTETPWQEAEPEGK